MLKPTREYLKLLTESLSNETGVKISEGKSWSCSLKTREVFYKPEDLKDMDYSVIRGLLLHETAHINYTTADANEGNRPYTKKYGTVIHEIYNAYEDIRIEHLLRNKYGNYAEDSLNHTNAHSVAFQLEKSGGDMTKAPELHQFLLTHLFQHDSSINPFSEQLIGYRASEIIYGDRMKISDKVKDRLISNNNPLANFLDDVKNCGTTGELMNLTDERLIPIIEDLIKTAPPDQKMPSMSNREQVFGNGNGKVTTTNKSRRMEKMTETEAKALLTPYINTLAHRLHDILEEQRATRYRGAKKSGKLLSPNAYKVLTGDTRIFSRKTTPDAPDYDIFVGLDSSGSMGEKNRIYYAHLSAVLLNEVSKKLGFKVTFYSYGNHAEQLNRIDNYGQYGGGTNDNALIERIKQDINPEKKSLIFVITDGYANRTNTIGFQNEFKEMEAEITKKGGTIYGIGMGNLDREIFKTNYKNAVIVPDIEKLPTEMIGIIRQVIHR